MEQKLRLKEFKELYKRLKKDVVWFDYLLFGLLFCIEGILIDLKVQRAVDAALEQIELPTDDYVTPVITEKPSEGSTSLSEVRITAPWYKETKD